MVGITFEKSGCPCLSCIYLLQVTRMNKKSNGDCDLRVYCSISGCPKGVTRQRENYADIKQFETYCRITDCIEMLKRCIENKSKGRAGVA